MTVKGKEREKEVNERERKKIENELITKKSRKGKVLEMTKRQKFDRGACKVC